MSKDKDRYNDKEAQKRFEDTLRGAMKVAPKPHLGRFAKKGKAKPQKGKPGK